MRSSEEDSFSLENGMNKHKVISAFRGWSGVRDGPVCSDADLAEELVVLEGRMAFRTLGSCLASF